MSLTLEVGTSTLKAKNDSQLVVSQVYNKYLAKEPRLIEYFNKVYDFSKCFKTFKIMHMLRERNFRANLLSKHAVQRKQGSAAS